MSGESTDLTTKYQKLATEYAKLRSQVVVLKKGVLDQQEVNNQLTDQLHERETQLRKHESEMEGVLFRNQQLSKRVNVLQDEIDNMQVKSKSKWNGSTVDKEREDSRVISEELVAKITENARLHATLDDIEKQFENTIMSLQNRVQDLEKEKSVLGVEKKNKEMEVDQSLAAITKENEELRQRVTLLERDLSVRSKQNESLEVQVAVLTQKNRSLEGVERREFSSQYSWVDPGADREREERRREIVNLSTRLEEAQSRVVEVERDREHWKLEFQLANIKLGKHNQQQQQPGTVQDQQEVEPTEISKARETEIKSAFENRLGELVVERIMSDSKATSYYLECEALALKVAGLEADLTGLSDDLELKREMLTRGEEEIKTMQLNYEEQLSVMSDHLAEMNHKLTTQEDTIIHLRQESFESPTEGKKKKK